MSIEPIHVAPITEQVEPPAPARLTTPDDLRAVDHVFAAQEREQQFVSGLLGLYTGTLLLKDLAADHLSHEEEENEDEPEADGPPKE